MAKYSWVPVKRRLMESYTKGSLAVNRPLDLSWLNPGSYSSIDPVKLTSVLPGAIYPAGWFTTIGADIIKSHHGRPSFFGESSSSDFCSVHFWIGINCDDMLAKNQIQKASYLNCLCCFENSMSGDITRFVVLKWQLVAFKVVKWYNMLGAIHIVEVKVAVFDFGAWASMNLGHESNARKKHNHIEIIESNRRCESGWAEKRNTQV